MFERTNSIVTIKNFKVVPHLRVLLGFTAADATGKKEAINCIRTSGISIHHLNLPAYEEKCQLARC